MKSRLSLLEVCRLPDVQLHSRQAHFKTLVGKQNGEALDMKEQIVRLSYTVKTIGVQGGQVGVSSKRVPLKLPKKEEYQPPAFHSGSQYLPHQSFYSQALVPIRKDKDRLELLGESPLLGMSARGVIHIDSDPSYETHQFKTRAKSMAHLRSPAGRHNADGAKEEFGQIQGRARGSSAVKKQSFSSLLKEVSLKQGSEEINPLMHEQNPLFKKIKRIRSVYPSLCAQPEPASSFRRPPTKHSSSGNLLKYYRDKL